MKKLTKEQELIAWKTAIWTAIQSMNPSGLIELPGNKFLIMFDRELNKEELEKARILKFQDFGNAYMYSYNSEIELKGIVRMFDAEIIALWDSVIVYDREVNSKILKGIPNLNFKLKTRINLYEVDYQPQNK